MAKVKFGSAVTSISGKVGGSVFLHNNGRNVVRTTTGSVSRSSQLQQSQRIFLRGAAAGWRSLTDQQREAWRYAAMILKSGQSGKITGKNGGYNLFMSSNILRLSTGNTILTLPNNGAQSMNIRNIAWACVVASVSITLGYTPGAGMAGNFLGIYMQRACQKGQSKPTSKYKLLVTDSSTSHTSNYWTLYTAAFTGPVAGQRIFWKIQIRLNQNGRYGGVITGFFDCT